MSDQVSEHYMYELNITRVLIYAEARNNMPTRMTVVTFASFANLNRRFNF